MVTEIPLFWVLVSLHCIHTVIAQGNHSFLLKIHQTNQLKQAEPPKILPAAKELILKEGSQFKSICATLQGSSPLEFSWSKDNEKILSDSNHEVLTTENMLSTLVIKKIDIRHSGGYTCTVQNAHGKDQWTVVLKVKCEQSLIFHYVKSNVMFSANLKWSKEPQNLSLKYGGEANIPCEAEGYPEPIVTWKRLDSPNGLSFYDNKFNIISANSEDAGNYECFVKNSEGDILTKVVSVSVIGKMNTLKFLRLIVNIG